MTPAPIHLTLVYVDTSPDTVALTVETDPGGNAGHRHLTVDGLPAAWCALDPPAPTPEHPDHPEYLRLVIAPHREPSVAILSASCCGQTRSSRPCPSRCWLAPAARSALPPVPRTVPSPPRTRPRTAWCPARSLCSRSRRSSWGCSPPPISHQASHLHPSRHPPHRPSRHPRPRRAPPPPSGKRGPARALATAVPPSIALTPLALTLRADTSPDASQTIHLVNLGPTPLIVDHLAVTGPDAPDFVARSTCRDRSIVPTDGCTIILAFRLHALRRASLLIADNTADSPHVLSLTGRSPPSHVKVSVSP